MIERSLFAFAIDRTGKGMEMAAPAAAWARFLRGKLFRGAGRPAAAKKETVQMAKDRFVKTYSQGALNITEIWVDRETGVNYVFHASGNAGGLTPLLDREGKPVVTSVYDEE